MSSLTIEKLFKDEREVGKTFKGTKKYYVWEFVLNGKFVFKENKKERNYCKSLLKVYASYSITGLFLTAILLHVEEKILEIPHYIATLMNLIVTIPLNFILNKFWAYKEKKQPKGDNQ